MILKMLKKSLKENKNTFYAKDFSSIKVNWKKNKNENIREILSELNLRAENTLFVDDNEYERNIVKSDLKEINIFDFRKNILLLNKNFNNLFKIYQKILIEILISLTHNTYQMSKKEDF